MKGSPRFLCDVMLARLARYLRAAGYDTLLAEDTTPDRKILEHAADDARWVLTVDRKIMEHKAAAGRTILLPHGSLDAQAEVLSAKFGMDWLGRAFSRCLVDNALLVAAEPEQLRNIPADARRPAEAIMACPECGRVYWRGSHYRRMKERLIRWQNLPK